MDESKALGISAAVEHSPGTSSAKSSNSVIDFFKAKHFFLKRDLGEQSFQVEVCLGPGVTKVQSSDPLLVYQDADPRLVSRVVSFLSDSQTAGDGVPRRDSVSDKAEQAFGVRQMWLPFLDCGVFYEYNEKAQRVCIQMILRSKPKRLVVGSLADVITLNVNGSRTTQWIVACAAFVFLFFNLSVVVGTIAKNKRLSAQLAQIEMSAAAMQAEVNAIESQRQVVLSSSQSVYLPSLIFPTFRARFDPVFRPPRNSAASPEVERPTPLPKASPVNAVQSSGTTEIQRTTLRPPNTRERLSRASVGLLENDPPSSEVYGATYAWTGPR